MNKTVYVMGPFNTGTNLMENIINNCNCVNLETLTSIEAKYKDVWKHTLNYSELTKIVKDGIVIIMYKNVYNWLNSVYKNKYDIKVGSINDPVYLNDKIYINNKVFFKKCKFSNIIEIHNYYYCMYKKLITNNNNVIFIDYGKIIDKSSAFEYINSKLIANNICIVSKEKLINTLDTPSNTHGINVQTSDSAINSYDTNKIKWLNIVVHKSKISASLNHTIIDFFEKKEENEYRNQNNEETVAICL